MAFFRIAAQQLRKIRGLFCGTMFFLFLFSSQHISVLKMISWVHCRYQGCFLGGTTPSIALQRQVMPSDAMSHGAKRTRKPSPLKQSQVKWPCSNFPSPKRETTSRTWCYLNYRFEAGMFFHSRAGILRERYFYTAIGQVFYPYYDKYYYILDLTPHPTVVNEGLYGSPTKKSIFLVVTATGWRVNANYIHYQPENTWVTGVMAPNPHIWPDQGPKNLGNQLEARKW